MFNISKNGFQYICIIIDTHFSSSALNFSVKFQATCHWFACPIHFQFAINQISSNFPSSICPGPWRTTEHLLLGLWNQIIANFPLVLMEVRIPPIRRAIKTLQVKCGERFDRRFSFCRAVFHSPPKTC